MVAFQLGEDREDQAKSFGSHRPAGFGKSRHKAVASTLVAMLHPSSDGLQLAIASNLLAMLQV